MKDPEINSRPLQHLANIIFQSFTYPFELRRMDSLF